MEPFIAVDWGTTNRRAFLVADGEVRDELRDGRGVLGMGGQGYEEAVADLRARFGDRRVLVAGMTGSNRGWRETRYLPCPATLADVAAGLLWVEAGRTALLPGIAWKDGRRGDVMRGEEVQLLGAAAAGAAPPGALLCQPGTHTKWARVKGGAVTTFDTAMTGELFAVLRDGSILSGQLAGEARDGPAFRDGVSDAGERPLTDALFGVRAAGLLGLRADVDAASYLSGLLIGADVLARDVRGGTVGLVADEPLATLYAAALAEAGAAAAVIDPRDAFVAGISEIGRMIA